ncbi:sodium-dependent bicarbonate transport family permease [Cyclobacterium sp. SYSU L10401]|uniref:sodium-dependent bicarbonate transport family permease n=1 Tax=Cyclobacterium sp. SYSU L10401 TaxID=2678657 RepID=UPI0013D7E5F3|nr:sodium-dependent bicarbonate transport family permease [Cyclobacterium sp. SYSU L10401]
MDIKLLLESLTNPALLFFFLGILAVKFKSDLKIPENSSKFISLYLLFAIGFKGGQELAHSEFGMGILWAIAFGIGTACLIPIYTFFVLKKRLGLENAGAIAAAYGSVSAVTFVTAASFLEMQYLQFSGHMVAIMALMEAPAIIIGVLLIRWFGNGKSGQTSLWGILKHSITNGSVFLIIGSLIIGFLANEHEAEGIKPFTTDIFKGFLAIFLLDMGISSGKKLKDFLQSGWFTTAFAIVTPLVNGVLVAYLSSWVSPEPGDRFMLAILAASASYIAVPAAMKMAVPKANPGIFLPMALAVTFPVNITIGFPLYFMVINL